MDNRPVGVFDSGLGGLTAVKALKKHMPNEDIVYFGDTARVPYGTRTKEVLVKFASQNFAFLRTHDVKCVIVACGTISSEVLPKYSYDLPVTGVVGASAKTAAALTKNRRVGVIATQAAIRGKGYEQALLAADPGIAVTSTAAPLLVPIIENGRVHPGDIIPETLVAEYLTPHKEAGIDTLILGCTHYPLLMDIVRKFMGNTVNIVDSGAAAASEASKTLFGSNLCADTQRIGSCSFHVSDNAEGFIESAGLFLGEDVRDRVFTVDSRLFM